MWLPLLMLSGAAQASPEAAPAAPGPAPTAGPVDVLVVGAAEVAGLQREPLAWASADAAAWGTAARTFAAPERIEVLSGAVTSTALGQAVERLRGRQLQTPAATTLVIVLGQGRRARLANESGSMELGLADRWVTANELNALFGGFSGRTVLIADVDEAFRWLWPLAPDARWTASDALTPPQLGGRPITAVVETRRRTEHARLLGSALSVRARSCLLGLADIDGDAHIGARELSRCVNLMPPTPQSVPLAVPGEQGALVDGGAAAALALPRPGVGLSVQAGDGAVLALAQGAAGHRGALRLPVGVARTVEELIVEAEQGTTPTLTPAQARALAPVGVPLATEPKLPRDLWGLSADEEAELDVRLRLAGAFEADGEGGMSLLWLAGGGAAGAVGLGLVLAEITLVGADAFELTPSGLRPAMMAGAALLVFGAALGAGALIAPLFSDTPAPASPPPPGRGRRRAIGAAVGQLEDDVEGDGTWRLVAAVAAAGAAGAVGLGAAGVVGGVLFGSFGVDDDTRRILAISAGGAAAMAVALGAIAVVLSLTRSQSRRLLDALELEDPLEEGPITPERGLPAEE